MMVLFFHARAHGHGRVRSVSFLAPDRRSAAELPEGALIVERHYYPTSSIFFYTDRTALLLNGRVLNLEYGSNAPGAADVFIDDQNSQLSGRPSRASIWSARKPASPACKIWWAPQTSTSSPKAAASSCSQIIRMPAVRPRPRPQSHGLRRGTALPYPHFAALAIYHQER